MVQLWEDSMGAHKKNSKSIGIDTHIFAIETRAKMICDLKKKDSYNGVTSTELAAMNHAEHILKICEQIRLVFNLR
jgi:hypothetical protein